MKLNELLEGIHSTKLRETNFIYLERFVNDAKGDFKKFSEINSRYSPEKGEIKFEAPYANIDISDLTVFTDQPSKELCDQIFRENTAVFIWHPHIPSPFGKKDGYFMVAPTSSTRTLLTQHLPYNFMAKTDLDKRHFRFIRRLKGSSVEHSLAINHDIRQATETGEIPFYAYLPETIGFVYGDMRTGSGVIYRKFRPRPYIDDDRIIIPYFSLYSRDTYFPQDKPLLFELVDLNGKYNPLRHCCQTSLYQKISKIQFKKS